MHFKKTQLRLTKSKFNKHTLFINSNHLDNLPSVHNQVPMPTTNTVINNNVYVNR